jgi:ribosomal protein S18 acetylase RimI-like enzyme
VQHPLDNPVFNALLTGEAHQAFGSSDVKFFHEQVSPFAGFSTVTKDGFDQLYRLLPAGRKILIASPAKIEEYGKWKLKLHLEGVQFVYDHTPAFESINYSLQALNEEHVEEMIALAKLTKPGPFDQRTIEFGHYHGIFEKGKLVAMAGQRLHVSNYAEISAVCTHPDHLGKGYAGLLIKHQLELICNEGKNPFLHVRGDNERAIALYHRLGFKVRGPMNFYFLQRD